MLSKKPALSGKMYASSFDVLDKQIHQGFVHADGPGELPSRREGKTLLGMISPHGVYNECGSAMAWGYKEIAESVLPHLFVVLGRGGAREGFFTMLFSGWETPIGVMQAAREEGRALMTLFPQLKNDMSAFFDDDAIELQLPFLQFANKDRLHEIHFIPLLVNSTDYDACQKLGEALAEFHEQHPFCMIGGCNLHGDASDAALVDALKTLNTKKIHDICNMRKAPGDFLTFIEAMKHLFVREGELLHYRPGSAALSYRR